MCSEHAVCKWQGHDIRLGVHACYSDMIAQMFNFVSLTERLRAAMLNFKKTLVLTV